MKRSRKKDSKHLTAPRFCLYTLVAILLIVIVYTLVVVLTRPTHTPGITEANTSETVNATAVAATKTQLLYLIEEEKLAHDVYSVLYEQYGANAFGNILESESTHQLRVLTLLDTYSITDPRSHQVGVFSNQELQNLYNELIEKGSQSLTDAYEVGVIIEKKDIEDISAQLATTDPIDTDIIETLEALRRGSENHLRAFQRQL